MALALRGSELAGATRSLASRRGDGASSCLAVARRWRGCFDAEASACYAMVIDTLHASDTGTVSLVVSPCW